MIIRQAEKKDLKQIADVHIRCFTDSFSTQLGKHRRGYLQQQFYKEYLDDVPELFLVAEDKGTIVGFCMGYYCERNNYMHNYLKNNFLQIMSRAFFLILTGNNQAWRKIKGIFIKKDAFEVINNEIKVDVENTGDLLSICVIPECRGNGTAQSLMDKYLEQLRKSGKRLCLLTVDVENDRGIHFYEKNGFLGYKEAAMQARTYAKII